MTLASRDMDNHKKTLTEIVQLDWPCPSPTILMFHALTCLCLDKFFFIEGLCDRSGEVSEHSLLYVQLKPKLLQRPNACRQLDDTEGRPTFPQFPGLTPKRVLLNLKVSGLELQSRHMHVLQATFCVCRQSLKTHVPF